MEVRELLVAAPMLGGSDVTGHPPLGDDGDA